MSLADTPCEVCRTRNADDDGCWKIGTYMAGCGSSERLHGRTLPTTPTTVIHFGGATIVIRLPITFPSGQNCRAVVWLTITTGGASFRSLSLNSRPSNSGIPIVRKYSGLAAK